MKNPKKKTVLVLLIFLLIILVGGITYFYFQQSNQSTTEEDTPINAEVVLKDNYSENLTDVYLKDLETEEEEFFITVSDFHTTHYHPYEYHNGHLYIIRRIGDTTGESWADELWRYDQDNQEKKLYSLAGLDFRVSEDESIIAIKEPGNEFTLLDNQGDVLKKFLLSDLIDTSSADESTDIYFTEVNSEDIWLDVVIHMELQSIKQINTTSYEVITHDLKDLEIGSEYSLNATNQILAYSDYPIFFDADSSEDFENGNTEVTLYIYNLATKEVEEINTTVSSKFKPVWLDSITLEYNNPEGDNRLVYQL
jgi:hypothetical protein